MALVLSLSSVEIALIATLFILVFRRPLLDLSAQVFRRF